MRVKNKIIFVLFILFSILLSFNTNVHADETLTLENNLAATWGNEDIYYQYQIVLTNNSSEKVTSWEICLDSNIDLTENNINQVCNAEYYLKDGNIYIKGTGWTEGINANSSLTGIIVTVVIPKGNGIDSILVSDYTLENSNINIPDNENNNENTNEETENENLENNEGIQEIIIPNYVGLDISLNKNDIENFCNQNSITLTTNYEYSENYNEDVIISQDYNNNKLVLNVSLGSQLSHETFIPDGTNSSNFGLVSGNPITIDGDFSDWNDKPYSYEYNWNNNYYIENYWDATLGKNITKYWYDENGKAYNTEIRHKVQLYSDGTYIYLHIIFAENYYSYFNGEDYNFQLDGKNVKFQISKELGNIVTLTNEKKDVGKYAVFVHHGDTSISSAFAEGSEAIYVIYNSENKNNEIELKIPVSEMKRQNNSIDVETFSKVTWYCPNLTYRNIEVSCTPTLPVLVSGLLVLGTFGSYFYLKKKERTEGI